MKKWENDTAKEKNKVENGTFVSPFVTLGLFIFDLSVYSTPQLRMPIVSGRIFFS